MLIQVMATLLGFTLVVVFYYLGKFDDQKKILSAALSR
jgi:hypothetical protein